MIRATRPMDETVQDGVMTIDLPPPPYALFISLLAIASGLAFSQAIAFLAVSSAVPISALQRMIILCFVLLWCAWLALKKSSGRRLVIDKNKARVLDGVTLFGMQPRAKETALNGYSGVQMSVRNEFWRVELTGFEKEKLPLVEFASEDHARAFADRLRLFLQS